MSDLSLNYRLILVVEDDYMMADDLGRELEAEGCVVLGPVATVEDALGIIHREALDAAVVDIDLRGEKSFPVADALIAQGIPFVFATGYSEKDVPSRYDYIKHCGKPVESSEILKALTREVNQGRQG